MAYWRLNETAVRWPKTVAGHFNGAYLNGVTLGVPGVPAGQSNNVAANFLSDMQQRADVPFSPELNPPVFTVEAWARLTGARRYRSPLTSRADGPQRGYIFYRPAPTLAILERKGDTSGWADLADRRWRQTPGHTWPGL